MKITNLTIIFTLIALSVFTILSIKTDELNAVALKTIEYNKELDSAVDDAVNNMVEVDDNRNLYINKELCLQKFYDSLFANFGMIGDENKQKMLQLYVPVALITDEDGYYIMYHDTYVQNGETILGQRWTEKRPYTYREKNLIYSFMMTDYVKIYDLDSNEKREGRREDLSSYYPDSILQNKALFDAQRRSSIVSLLTEEMTYYVNKHNTIANQYGITYDFYLPSIEQDDWYRTIDDISFMAVFQGYPFGSDIVKRYNRYAFGGSRIYKNKVYYIQAEGNFIYYHKLGCKRLTSMEFIHSSKKECALEGAYPCQECNP